MLNSKRQDAQLQAHIFGVMKADRLLKTPLPAPPRTNSFFQSMKNIVSGLVCKMKNTSIVKYVSSYFSPYTATVKPFTVSLPKNNMVENNMVEMATLLPPDQQFILNENGVYQWQKV